MVVGHVGQTGEGFIERIVRGCELRVQHLIERRRFSELAQAFQGGSGAVKTARDEIGLGLPPDRIGIAGRPLELLVRPNAAGQADQDQPGGPEQPAARAARRKSPPRAAGQEQNICWICPGRVLPPCSFPIEINR